MTALQVSDWSTGLGLFHEAVSSVPSDQPQASEKPFLVDVGGGYGHQCTEVLKKYPTLHGRLVLEDLPQTIDSLPPIDGVKALTQDFFEEQAIKGMPHSSGRLTRNLATDKRT